jgi:hypothetical protein
MDETKRILGDRFPRGFQDNLYALLFNPDLGVSDYIAFVFSGAQHLYQLSDDDTSPLGSRATSHVIENMSESDVHSFCTLVLPSSDQTRTDEFVTWLYGLTFGQAGLTAKALRMASELGSIESALDKRESLADELKTQSVGLVRNWASSFTDEARTVIVHFGSRTSVTQKEISRVLTEQKRDQYAADRVAEELLYTGAVINRHARLLKGNPLLWEYMDQYGKEDTGSEDEREAWNLIEEAELALREYVREKYQQEWPARAFEQMKIHLGIEEWNKLLDIQKRSIGKYAYSPSYTGRDEMSCMYLGQLLTLMIHGKAWPHFAHLFRDKRQLEDMMSAITPVRADRAHFTNVPEKELVRCKIACDDLLVILAK